MISAGFSNFETDLINKELTFDKHQPLVDKAHDTKNSEDLECTTEDRMK